MAVLKSPRNSRNKKKWAQQYSLTRQKLDYRFEERKSARSAHDLHLFLRDSAHWVVMSGEVPTYNPQEAILNEVKSAPLIIRYGSNHFDSTRPHPLILRKQLRRPSTRENLMTLLNSRTLV